MKRPKPISITESELQQIHGKDWELFKSKILTTTFCGNCTPYNVTTITDYTARLNDLNDVELSGVCLKCKKPVGRYVETGDVLEYRKSIQKVREQHISSKPKDKT